MRSPSLSESRGSGVTGVGRPANSRKRLVILRDELLVGPGVAKGLFQFEARGHQSLGNEASAEPTETSASVGFAHGRDRVHFSPFCPRTRHAR